MLSNSQLISGVNVCIIHILITKGGADTPYIGVKKCLDNLVHLILIQRR
jgi:hypothetical protein